MTIRIISRTKIKQNKTITLDREITDILEVNRGDEILYILNKNGIVNIRKFKGNVILGPGEKYLSSCMVSYDGDHFTTTITTDVRQAINVDMGDDALLIIDNDRNIIIRNAFLLNRCSIDMINKNISSLVIDITTFFQNKTTLPKNTRDILEVGEGDIIILSLDDSDNIIVQSVYQLNKQLPCKQLSTTKVVSQINLTTPVDHCPKEGSNRLKPITPAGHYQLNKQLPVEAGHCQLKTVSQKMAKNLLQEVKLLRDAQFIISKELSDTLNIITGDKILWIIDEDGNIIMRNAILSDNCI